MAGSSGMGETVTRSLADAEELAPALQGRAVLSKGTVRVKLQGYGAVWPVAWTKLVRFYFRG